MLTPELLAEIRAAVAAGVPGTPDDEVMVAWLAELLAEVDRLRALAGEV